MRFLLFAMAALALSACGDQQRDAAGDCIATATRELSWPEGDARVTVTASSDGQDCDTAIATLVLHSAGGRTMHVFTAPYADVAPSLAPGDAEAFIESWADVTQLRSGALPEWSAAMANPGEGVQALPYRSRLEREAYEAMRAQNLATVCMATALDATECFVIDADEGARSVLGYAS